MGIAKKSIVFFLSIWISLLTISLRAQTKRICFTLDDLPVVNYGMNDSDFYHFVNGKIISTLKKYRIPAIGFVNGSKLYHKDKIDPFQVNLLAEWLQNGLELGNHTYAHKDFNSVSFQEFKQDITQGEQTLQTTLPQYAGMPHFFRHPFLHMGNTRERSDSLSNFLVQQGYTIAPVTIDNEDYLFALAYSRAFRKKDSLLMQTIHTDYITYMERKLAYYDRQSCRLFNRSINQILLIHASLLNADCMSELAKICLQNKYIFISLREALTDQAYQTPITRFGNWGISWIDRWALSAGKTSDFFKDDPVTPDYIYKLAE
jgi:peptidoglycan/xylan/chitin deacetylase (PgdA/CDA1 family)